MSMMSGRGGSGKIWVITNFSQNFAYITPMGRRHIGGPQLCRPEELEALPGHFGKAWTSTFDSRAIYRDRENVDKLASI